MLKQFILISAVAALPFCSSAADKVKALPVKDSEIKLDGVLDEAVWKNAPRQGGFTRLRYAEIKSAEETFFQVAASEKGLYWAFDVKDRNNISTITQYDASISREDVIELFITADDPIPDDPNVHNCRQLIFNAIGTRADLAHQSGVQNSKWNSDWRVAVKKYDGGFRAELFLPYYALNIVNRQTRKYSGWQTGTFCLAAHRQICRSDQVRRLGTALYRFFRVSVENRIAGTQNHPHCQRYGAGSHRFGFRSAEWSDHRAGNGTAQWQDRRVQPHECQSRLRSQYSLYPADGAGFFRRILCDRHRP